MCVIKFTVPSLCLTMISYLVVSTQVDFEWVCLATDSDRWVGQK